MGWILKSSLDGASIEPIIVLSTLFSLWSLTSKVSADDKLILYDFSPYYEKLKGINFKCKCKFPFIHISWLYLVRVILWRFLEITCRINLCLLIWINIGGFTLSVILSVELFVCLIICIAEKSYVCLYSIYVITTNNNH